MTRGQQPLVELLQQLQAILQSIPVLESRGYKPPIIDGDGYAHNGDPIIGLRIFKDAVSREVEILEQFLSARPDHGSELSTNAPYFVAVWNEILSAPPPIIAIGRIFEPPDGRKKKKAAAGSAQPGGIKVDVVADEGRKWIRVNTMKNSRMMAEFREIDSYLTGSEDEVGERFDVPTDNSLLRMGRALVIASTVPIAGTNERPSVTLRLTRLQPGSADGDGDARIAETVETLKHMGLDVQLGERVFRGLQSGEGAVNEPCGSGVQLRPARRINMDLSILIALVSDLSHAELPEGEEGAWARFRMPVNTRSWKLGKRRVSAPGAADEEGEYSKHSRALSMQCFQEMERGVIDEVVERLQVHVQVQSGRGRGKVEFWTTGEARDRCLQIVEKIGGVGEKRRVRAMFPPAQATADVSLCQEEFWRGSRYGASYFSGLLPIRIHPPHPAPVPGPADGPGSRDGSSVSSLFWGHLIQTCRHILSQDAAPHPRVGGKIKEGEMERAKVTGGNPRLTVHTVESMLTGACAGMTTLTANKASVRALLREMKGVRWGCEDAPGVVAVESREGDGEGCVEAAIWIVEPRSLAEGMRCDRVPVLDAA